MRLLSPGTCPPWPWMTQGQWRTRDHGWLKEEVSCGLRVLLSCHGPYSWSLNPGASQKGPGLCPHFWHLTHQGALRLMSLRRHTGPDSRRPRRPPEEFDFDCGGDREAEKSLSRSGNGQTRQSQAPHGQALGISFLWPL